MICAHCHSEIADDSMFCTECGAKVEASAASSMLRPSRPRLVRIAVTTFRQTLSSAPCAGHASKRR